MPLAVAFVPHPTALTPAVAPAPVWGSPPVVLPPQTNCAPALGAATTRTIAVEKMAQMAKRAVRRRRRLVGMMTPPRDQPLWRRKRMPWTVPVGMIAVKSYNQVLHLAVSDQPHIQRMRCSRSIAQARHGHAR